VSIDQSAQAVAVVPPSVPVPDRGGTDPCADLRRLQLVDEDGVVDSDGGAWLRSASREDRQVLARATGPVLDVGCGPGRHVRALQALGVEVLGIDLSPSVLETATRRGAVVRAGSVFDPLPRMGQWQTALLLDGNFGLGGDPLDLLLRLRRVLRPNGRVLADLVTGPPMPSRRLRLRHGCHLGPEFPWAPLHLDDLDAVAAGANFEVVDVWRGERRWFCELGLATGGSAAPSPDRTAPADRHRSGVPHSPRAWSRSAVIEGVVRSV